MQMAKQLLPRDLLKNEKTFCFSLGQQNCSQKAQTSAKFLTRPMKLLRIYPLCFLKILFYTFSHKAHLWLWLLQ